MIKIVPKSLLFLLTILSLTIEWTKGERNITGMARRKQFQPKSRGDLAKEFLNAQEGLIRGRVLAHSINTSPQVDMSPARVTRNETSSRFACPNCTRTFSTKFNLERHLKPKLDSNTVHCPNCTKTFARAYNLKAHLASIHGLGEKFHCPNCTKTYGRVDNLKSHLANVHGLGQNFRCPNCTKTFGRVDNLKRHSDGVHCSGQKTPCPNCSRTFCDRSTLQRHIRMVHGCLARLTCTKCSRSLKNKESLQLHMKRLHNDRENLTRKNFGRGKNSDSTISFGRKNDTLYGRQKRQRPMVYDESKCKRAKFDTI